MLDTCQLLTIEEKWEISHFVCVINSDESREEFIMGDFPHPLGTKFTIPLNWVEALGWNSNASQQKLVTMPMYMDSQDENLKGLHHHQEVLHNASFTILIAKFVLEREDWLRAPSGPPVFWSFLENFWWKKRTFPKSSPRKLKKPELITQWPGEERAC